MTIKIHTKLVDDLDPEVQAMLIAMYSRDSSSIVTRLPSSIESKEQHKEKFKKYFLDYGHKSIGQCGVTTVFFENVSLIAAKCIENHPLFNGQECSTRYIDFTKQPLISDSPATTVIQEALMKEYTWQLEAVTAKLMKEHPSNTKVQVNSIKARAFDICRGLLPAGVTTNVAMVASFDTFINHLGMLLYHPLTEVSKIAVATLYKLKQDYPTAIPDMEDLLQEYHYMLGKEQYFYTTNVQEYTKNIAPIQRELVPLSESKIALQGFEGLLDYGSYRDLHRHRNGVINFPKLDTYLGFHPWYSEHLIHREPLTEVLLSCMGANPYAIPLGFRVPVKYTCDVNQYNYVLGLRSGMSSHPTLRQFVLGEDFVDSFNPVRGKQTFNMENQ